ncbi:MAG: hypothetical protein NVS3B25_19210 [Hymenobacter sp.]
MAAKPVTYQHSFRYPIDTLGPNERVLEKWPELAVHEKLVQFGFGENDGLLKYSIYLSEGSGLHTAVPDWTERKKEALRLAGILPTHPRYTAILELRDEPTQELRWTWLRAFSSRKMRAYVALSEAYDQHCRKVETPINDGDDQKEDAVQRAYKLRDELGRSLAQMDKDITALEKDLFMGDEELKRLATERAKPQAETGSIEEKIMNRKSK